MTNELNLDELKQAVSDWIADDPDSEDREELDSLLKQWPDSADDLADRFSGRLTFGTAGLRGRLRAGPNGMNLAVVSTAAAGLADWLNENEAQGPVVIGYDARYGSEKFAQQSARIIQGSGRYAYLMPHTVPTPLLAWAVNELNAVAGVMVTASHNPPQDNGYKVYLGEQLGGKRGAAAQIAPPADRDIEAAIQRVGSLADLPVDEFYTTLPLSITAGYIDAVSAIVDPKSPKDLSVVATPMHGVGGSTLVEAIYQAGFDEPTLVPSQAEPDPDFSTVSFPNPEEPGAMDRLLDLARERKADVAVALDPDADRCAVAAPTATGEWRALTGNEVGVLLADHLMHQGRSGTYVTTIVSTTQLERMCRDNEVPYAESLTGFKWIARAADDLAFGFEEALGYCVAPTVARDKDGIAAALSVCEIAGELRSQDKTVFDRLDELAERHGVYATGQVSVRVDETAEITAIMERLRAERPETLLSEPVVDYVDLAPETDVVTVKTDSVRLVVRPSGTEPKLKAYLEVRLDAAGDVTAARRQASDRLEQLRTEVRSTLGIN
ncbi:phospho-sugar mutase [Haloglycomyces albus]|uniref:phospho-sugar mutase n=1 Tax=Haloglycomyces albus TaxID=526067 RepID=UPI0004B9285D|nr:phospho-sugar mutase [Haloglycomyces albus]